MPIHMHVRTCICKSNKILKNKLHKYIRCSSKINTAHTTISTIFANNYALHTSMYVYAYINDFTMSIAFHSNILSM